MPINNTLDEEQVLKEKITKLIGEKSKFGFAEITLTFKEHNFVQSLAHLINLSTRKTVELIDDKKITAFYLRNHLLDCALNNQWNEVFKDRKVTIRINIDICPAENFPNSIIDGLEDAN